MKGDVVFRVYGVHGGRDADAPFGAFRTEAEAEAEAVALRAREMHGRNWAEQYHDQGIVVRRALVETDFEIPSLPKPRDRYAVRLTPISNGPAWDSTRVEVFRRVEPVPRLEKVAEYVRDYALLSTFEPFRQGGREYALISRNYTATAVPDLETGEVIAEEPVVQSGFCPVGFYVPDWWDVNRASPIPGDVSWDADHEWPGGDLGFVWGCVWGDDTSWKLQVLDLRRIREGAIARDERFGYLPVATHDHARPWLEEARDPVTPSKPPGFIRLERYEGAVRVGVDVELDFDLANGRVYESLREALARRLPLPEQGTCPGPIEDLRGRQGRPLDPGGLKW